MEDIIVVISKNKWTHARHAVRRSDNIWAIGLIDWMLRDGFKRRRRPLMKLKNEIRKFGINSGLENHRIGAVGGCWDRQSSFSDLSRSTMMMIIINMVIYSRNRAWARKLVRRYLASCSCHSESANTHVLVSEEKVASKFSLQCHRQPPSQLIRTFRGNITSGI